MEDDELFTQFAERLREAHRRVAAMDLAADEKSSTTRHLLVISDASKHSVARASQRLDAFLAELDARDETSRG